MSIPNNASKAIRSITLALLLALFSLIIPKDLSASAILPYDQRGDSLPFLPYLEYMLDETGTLNIEAVSLQEKSLQFMPLKPLDLETKTGTFWLRFTLGPVPEGGKPNEWLLSLGDSFPGDPTVYVPELQNQTGMPQWSAIPITDRHIFKLPPPGPEAKTCYLKLNGPPGLWFAPVLRSPQNAANNWGPLVKPATLITLAVIMLISLLRSFARNGQWCIWTALFVGGALASGYLGLPTVESGHIELGQFARALAPGFSLMLIPHVARHMMRSSVYSRIIDAQLILLTLVGAMVTLFPLVPGFSWTSRFLELWPLGTLLFIPTALWALFLGLPRSHVFLLVCFLPPIAIAGGVIGLLSGLPVDLLASLPLAGVALSAFFLMLTPSPPAPKSKNDDLEIKDDHFVDEPDDLSDLELAPKPKRNYKSELPNIELNDKPAVKLKNSPLNQADLGKYGQKISDPLEILLESAQILANSAKQTNIEAEITDLLFQARSIYKVVHPAENKPISEEVGTLDLEFFLREIYQQMQKIAFDKGLTFGWSIAPGSRQNFKGQIEPLQHTVKLLVESAVNATTKGGVYLTAAHTYKNSTSWLTFTIKDTGTIAGNARPGLGLLRALEVADSLGGELEVKSQGNGSQIILGVPLEVIDLETKAPNPIPRVVICSENVPVRHSLRALIATLNLRISEATSMEEAYALSKNDPPCLLIAHDTQASANAASIISQFKKLAREKGLPFCKILAITPDDREWKNLGRAGFTYALPEPVDNEALLTTIENVQQDYTKQLAQNHEPVAAKGNVPPFLGESNAKQAPPLDKLTQLPGILEKLFSLSQAELAYAIKYVTAKNNLEKVKGTQASHREVQSSLKAQEDSKENDPEPAPKRFPNLNLVDQTPLSQIPRRHPKYNESREAAINSAVEEALKPQGAPQKPAAQAAPKPAPKPVVTPKPTPKPQAEPTYPEDTAEWVGEPTPVKPQSAPEKPVQNAAPKPLVTPKPVVTPKPTPKPQPTYPEDADEWVGEPTPVKPQGAPEKPTTQTAPKPLVTPKPVVTPKPTPKPQSEPTYPEDADEWVGEPTPIVKPKQEAESTPTGTSQTPKSGTWFGDDEWVGEPTPVIKPKARQADPKAANHSSPNKDNDDYLGLNGAKINPDELDELKARISAATADSPHNQASEEARLIIEELEQEAKKTQTQPPLPQAPDLKIQEEQDQQVPPEYTESQSVIIKPEVLECLDRLDLAIHEAKQAFAGKQCLRVADAARRLAQDCDSFGFRRLARLARCVEQAGNAGDLDALNNLLPELIIKVEDNRLTLTQFDQDR